MDTKFDWKGYPYPKLIDEKGIEAIIRENNGEITVAEIMSEAGDQANLIVNMLAKENKVITSSEPEHQIATWVYNPKLFKQLMKKCKEVKH